MFRAALLITRSLHATRDSIPFVSTTLHSTSDVTSISTLRFHEHCISNKPEHFMLSLYYAYFNELSNPFL